MPFVEVIRAVARSGYDLLIKAAHPPAGLSERLFGSTDMQLLRKCPCPAWIDHPEAAPHYAQVPAAVDPLPGHDGGCARQVIGLASSLAEQVPADRIVMGTLGRVGIPGFFVGNTAEEVLQTSRASVLAVKPAGFVSPVR